MTIPTSPHGKSYAKSSMGVNVFSAGGVRRLHHKPHGSKSLETPSEFTVTSITDTTCTIGVTQINNPTGSAYATVDEDPIRSSRSQVRAGTNSLNQAATFDGVDTDVTDGTASIDVTGLTPATLYQVWWTHEVGVSLSPVAGVSFTTLA